MNKKIIIIGLFCLFLAVSALAEEEAVVSIETQSLKVSNSSTAEIKIESSESISGGALIETNKPKGTGKSILSASSDIKSLSTASSKMPKNALEAEKMGWKTKTAQG